MHVHSIQICLEQKQKVKLCGNSANIDSLVQKKKKKITEHLLWNTENILEQAERRIKMSAKERGGGDRTKSKQCGELEKSNRSTCLEEHRKGWLNCSPGISSEGREQWERRNLKTPEHLSNSGDLKMRCKVSLDTCPLSPLTSLPYNQHRPCAGLCCRFFTHTQDINNLFGLCPRFLTKKTLGISHEIGVSLSCWWMPLAGAPSGFRKEAAHQKDQLCD